MMTSPNKRELSNTTELYTGDIVELDGWNKKTEGVSFKVTATNSPIQCESGVMVTIVNGSQTMTVDRHWLKLMCKASEIDFDDDIPF
jgi:hypothetical protein